MMHTKHFAAARQTGLAFSLLLAIAGCAGSSGSTADAPCTDCGPSVAPPAPEGLGLTDTPELHVTLTDDASLSASLAAATIRVRPGADTTLEVRVDRSAFDGEVAVWAEGLPTGLVAEPAVMPGSVPTGRLIVGATEAAELGGPHAFTVVVSASGIEPVEVPARVVVAGAPGALDETFGTDGVATFEGRSVGVNSVAVDTQGRVLLAGRDWDASAILLERLRADGSFDGAYGEHVRAVLPEGLPTGASRMVLVGDEARVLMHGGLPSTGDFHFGFAAFDEAGRPDEAIGGNGVVAVMDLGSDEPQSMGLATGDGSVFFRLDDRLAALGPSGEVTEMSLPEGAHESWNMAYRNHTLTFAAVDDDPAGPVMLERVHTAGGIDERFGEGGVLRGETPSTEDFIESSTYEVAFLEEGGYAASIRWFTDGGSFGELVRFTADGQLDDGFGEGGRVTFQSEGERIQGLVVDGAGRPVLFTDQRPSFDRRLRRYTTTGELDRSFGEDGVVDLGPLGLRPTRRIALDAAADRLVTCGSTEGGDGWQCARFWL